MGMRSVEKKHRRFLAAILALCLLLGLCPLAPTARAEDTTEPATQSAVTNTTKETATEVNFNEEVRFELSASVREQWFKVTTTEPCQTVAIENLGEYGVSQESCRIQREDGKDIDTMLLDSNNGIAFYARKAATYYLRYTIFGGGSDNGTVLSCAFKLQVYANDAYEPNDSMAEAKDLDLGKDHAIIAVGYDEDWFKIETTKPGQLIQLVCSEKNRVFAKCYDASGRELSGRLVSDSCISTGAPGTYYLCFQDFIRTSGGGLALYDDPTLICVTLLDNDANEPNDTRENATMLKSGEKVEFILGAGDYDWFKITTDKPGQDIALTVSGYDYTNKGQTIGLTYEPGSNASNTATSKGYANISGDSTLYFHAAEATDHYVALYLMGDIWKNGFPICTRTLSVQILDGDKNEPNDTKETATRLNIGTDETFMVGGFGDEDWFSFEVDPGVEGEKNLYTLNFSGLNTDYSDSFYYDIYAPDGKAVVKQTLVNIQHSYVFNCDLQGGLYHVRVYTRAGVNGYNNKDYFGTDWNGNGRVSMEYPRSELRICVNKGGDDPYENNDTWQTAAYVPVGNIQHVLSSTADADWFCFNVPKSDMTLHLTSAARTNVLLYREDVLMKDGIEKAKSEFTNSRGYDDAEFFGDLYFKLTDAGIYYIKLTADSSYASPDIRTTGIELLPATDEENNDTWKKATPLYEGMVRSFELSAGNDVDWFKFVVPEDGARLRFSMTNSSHMNYAIYSKERFEASGDDAASIDGWDDPSRDTFSKVVELNKGTYYLKVSGYGRQKDLSISYITLRTTQEDNGTIQTAKPLAPGEWTEYYGYRSYFCIGERKAGEVVRVSRDFGNYVSELRLESAEGNRISNTYEANYTFGIPEDGKYYILAYWGEGAYPDRLRYDVGSGEGKVNAIESVDSLTLLEGEKMFLDLRCAPHGAMSSAGNTFYTRTPDCVNYEARYGYLTAQSAGTSTLTVSLNGDSSVKKDIPVTVLAKDSLKVEKLSIERAPETLSLGTSADLTAEYTLEGSVVLTNPEKAVTWTSSDPKVLYVSPGGKVTAVGGGTATVTATVGSVSEESAPITVTAVETPQETVSSIKLNKYSLTLYVGEAGEQLTASILPKGSTARVTWASSNTNAAAVSPDGVVTPIAPGVSSITAEAGGRRVSATVTVFAERVRVSGVSFDETEHKIPVRGTAKLTATVAPANATVKTLIWTSDDDSIATVSRTGIVTALHVGTTTIRATSVDGNHSAEITVTVTPSAELGDVNGDGYIDSADAMLCLRYSVGLAKLTEEQRRAANVNHDSFVDAGDAIKILRYDAKLIDSLN